MCQLGQLEDARLLSCALCEGIKEDQVCVCVCNFSREVKLVPELPWHYFGSISTYSVELLSHLVFRMSICFLFFVLVLAGKEFPYCNTILAGGTGPLWIPVPTKLFHNGGSED